MDDDRSRSFQSEAARLADAARDRAADAFDEVKVASSHVVDKVRDLIEEGNVRRISLRKGERVLFEIPLTVGVGAGAAALLTSPLLAAVGAVAALVSDITIAVERDVEAAGSAESAGAFASGGSGSGSGGSSPKESTPTDASKDATSTAGGSGSGGSGSSSSASGGSGGSGSGSDTSSGGKTVGKPSSGDA